MYTEEYVAAEFGNSFDTHWQIHVEGRVRQDRQSLKLRPSIMWTLAARLAWRFIDRGPLSFFIICVCGGGGWTPPHGSKRPVSVVYPFSIRCDIKNDRMFFAVYHPTAHPSNEVVSGQKTANEFVTLLVTHCFHTTFTNE